MERKYVKVEGSHISNSDAQKIGMAVELLFKKLGRNPLVSEFAEAVKNRTNPAHQVVKKKFEELKSSAWRAASEYCLRSVDIIVLEKGTPTPKKEFRLLDLAPESTEPRDVSDRYSIITRQMCQRSPEALAAEEREFRRKLHTLFADFADVAGNARMRRVVVNELDGLVHSIGVAAD
jgi:hypothetical protein